MPILTLGLQVATPNHVTLRSLNLLPFNKHMSKLILTWYEFFILTNFGVQILPLIYEGLFEYKFVYLCTRIFMRDVSVVMRVYVYMFFSI